MAQDVYTAISGEAINNGSSIIMVPQGSAQSYTTRAFNTPTIDTLSGQYENNWMYPRFYTGDTDD
jgi:hypothetical protein